MKVVPGESARAVYLDVAVNKSKDYEDDIARAPPGALYMT